MRSPVRWLGAVAAAVAASVLVAAPAFAHPLGNFTVNHFSEVTVAGNVARVDAVYDFAEIPTFQERQQEADDPTAAGRLVRGLAGRLRLGVDGRSLPLRLVDHRVRFLPGQAGLQTMRLELSLESDPLAADVHDATYSDTTYPDHLGWREVTVVAAGGARITASSVPSVSISQRLSSYPSGMLTSPLAVSSAHFRFVAGAVAAPRSGFVDGAASGFRTIQDRFSGLVAAPSLTPVAIALSLLVATALGALHALEPGHGKAIMAGYLVGTRGRPRDAAALGLTITATHTAGVFALGLLTLSAASFVTPGRLYPALNLVSGLLVLAIGGTLLLRGVNRGLHRHDTHHHDHGPGSHTHPHEHAHAGHDHGVTGAGLGRLGIIGVGISGGIVPCPAALVVLLAALSLHRLVFGLVLIVAFSLGLAAVLTGIGVILASGRGLISRVGATAGWRVLAGRLGGLAPGVSALVVTVAGAGLTLQAVQSLR
jgi:nickel/cobalt transporter (NicO) family protein